MRRILLLISVLLLSAGWALAQYSSGTSNNYGTNSNATQSENTTRSQSGNVNNATAKTSLEGCLSEANGRFTLTDQSGTEYELTGRTAALKNHVGHTIRVKGEEMMAGTGKPGAMSNEEAQGKPSFKVSSFRHISNTCKNPGEAPMH
jgi:hypothetical protein